MPKKQGTPKSTSARRPKKKSVPDSPKIDIKDPKGETKLVLLPVEPYLIHVFWEVTDTDLDQAKQQLGDKDQVSSFLRFYDVTNVSADKKDAHSTFDVQIDLRLKSWYVNLWSAGRSYFAELGFKTDTDHFYPIMRSDIVDVPTDEPAAGSMEFSQSTQKGEAQPHQSDKDYDITEINEREFKYGISSY